MNERIIIALCDERSARRLRIVRAVQDGLIPLAPRHVMQRFNVSKATAVRDLFAIRRALDLSTGASRIHRPSMTQ